MPFRDGGKVEAWYKDDKAVVATQTFHKIENVPLSVLFCSSQETNGEGVERIVDNNNSTYWHTMYSVTVAQYPHWVDFDANGTKLMKGFVYVPRQDSPNGRIKDYEIYVSQDGKTGVRPSPRVPSPTVRSNSASISHNRCVLATFASRRFRAKTDKTSLRRPNSN